MPTISCLSLCSAVLRWVVLCLLFDVVGLHVCPHNVSIYTVQQMLSPHLYESLRHGVLLETGRQEGEEPPRDKRGNRPTDDGPTITTALHINSFATEQERIA